MNHKLNKTNFISMFPELCTGKLVPDNWYIHEKGLGLAYFYGFDDGICKPTFGIYSNSLVTNISNWFSMDKHNVRNINNYKPAKTKEIQRYFLEMLRVSYNIYPGRKVICVHDTYTITNEIVVREDNVGIKAVLAGTSNTIILPIIEKGRSVIKHIMVL